MSFVTISKCYRRQCSEFRSDFCWSVGLAQNQIDNSRKR